MTAMQGYGGIFGRPRSPVPFMDMMNEGGAASDKREPAPTRRRGGLGGLFGGLTRRQDGDPGTFLNYLLFGPRGVANMRDQAMQRDMFGFQMRRAKMDEAESEQERMRLQEALATIEDPVQRAWATIAPAQAASRALAPPSAPDWQVDPVTGQPYAITPQGAVQYGQGRINVRPTGGAERAPPTGYRWTADGNLEAVPGGPADLRAGESAQRQRRSIDTAIRNQTNVIAAIQDAKRFAQVNDVVGMEATTGLAGQIWGNVGGTAAYNLRSAIDTIRANIGFEALQEMRANSQTGGALGQVAVRELELLQATVRNLDQAQTRAQLMRNLEAVERQYRRSVEAMERARAELDGGSSETDSRSSAPRVIELDPE